jgi:preprotein translocase subunit SecA
MNGTVGIERLFAVATNGAGRGYEIRCREGERIGRVHIWLLCRHGDNRKGAPLDFPICI